MAQSTRKGGKMEMENKEVDNCSHCTVSSQIMTPDESTEVGRISKQWSGLLKEAFTDSDNFGIRYSMFHSSKNQFCRFITPPPSHENIIEGVIC